MSRDVQLITYVDRLGGDLGGLREVLEGPLAGLFSGVHLLPFFTPYDAADAGFDPIDHGRVDPRLGDWSDVRRVSEGTPVVADLIVNHISRSSAQFQDVVARGRESELWEMFHRFSDAFVEPGGERPVAQIYRPRPGPPFTTVEMADGTTERFWTTFTDQQMDIDVESAPGRAYLIELLDRFQEGGVRTIRMDAAGYAIKRPGTSCFMLPETIDFIEEIAAEARRRGITTLVEVHDHYRRQLELASRVDWVYDFALPPLVLHALYAADARPLRRWLAVAPANRFTVLDTHDGIGIVDVASDDVAEGLLSDGTVDDLVEAIHRGSNGESRKATGAAASNLDLYQVNCTFFSALGERDVPYLLARAIQLFCSGVPQIYYVGLLAGKNDMELLAETGVGRDINRRYYTGESLRRAISKSVVQRLLELVRLRRDCAAFDGEFTTPECEDHELVLHWREGDETAELAVDLRKQVGTITLRGSDGERRLDLR